LLPERGASQNLQLFRQLFQAHLIADGASKGMDNARDDIRLGLKFAKDRQAILTLSVQAAHALVQAVQGQPVHPLSHDLLQHL